MNIYGTDETGFARSPWDNVGVQYGLAAVKSGAITPEQFLDLNANVGSWKRSCGHGAGGVPVHRGAVRNAAAGRLERTQHAALAGRRSYARQEA